MKTILHDLDPETVSIPAEAADRVIRADGRYAPCRGCFQCWTGTPASCALKDALRQLCRVLGESDDLTVITENTYGGCSAPVKTLLDRSIGVSTPLSAYRGGLMHHTLRYGKKGCLRMIVYGEITEAEKRTFELTAERNALNLGYREHSVVFCGTAKEAGDRA